MDYKISEYTWVPWDGDCDTCNDPCDGQIGPSCIPSCYYCDLYQPGRILPCSNCEARIPKIQGRMYFQPKGGTP